MDTKTMPDHFSLSFDSLGITCEHLAREVGYGADEIPEQFADVIGSLLDEAGQHAQIECGYLIISPERIQILSNGFRIDDTEFATGRNIAKALDNSERVALFLATAGAGFTSWSSSLMNDRQQLEGFFADVLGSVTVESAADCLEARITQWAKELGASTTHRYSPGYCGWHVKEQQKIFSFFPEDFCGISLTDSSLMIPIKSVSGVIGIGKEVEKSPYGCDICNMKDCFARRSRT